MMFLGGQVSGKVRLPLQSSKHEDRWLSIHWIEDYNLLLLQKHSDLLRNISQHDIYFNGTLVKVAFTLDHIQRLQGVMNTASSEGL